MGAVHKQFGTVFLRDLTALSGSIVGRMQRPASARALGYEDPGALTCCRRPSLGPRLRALTVGMTPVGLMSFRPRGSASATAAWPRPGVDDHP
jgi:hypothetical protein